MLRRWRAFMKDLGWTIAEAIAEFRPGPERSRAARSPAKDDPHRAVYPMDEIAARRRRRTRRP